MSSAFDAMKISIVTVTYNCVATIGDTLRSVASQTYPDIEHIVIDGGSTDGTLQTIESHRTRVSCLISEPDNGIYDAMNKGIARASGDLVGFLNADDVLASADAITCIAEAARDGVDAVYGDLVYVRTTNLDKVVRRWRSGAFARDRLRFGWMPPHPTFYVRTALLRDIGGFDDGLRVAADYDLMLRCLMRPGLRIAYVRSVLVRMRLGGASNASSSALQRKSREDLVVMRRHGIGGWFTLLSKNVRKLPQFF